MVKMGQDSLIVAALLLSVRASWKVTVYYINGALLTLNRYALCITNINIINWHFQQDCQNFQSQVDVWRFRGIGTKKNYKRSFYDLGKSKRFRFKYKNLFTYIEISYHKTMLFKGRQIKTFLKRKRFSNLT